MKKFLIIFLSIFALAIPCIVSAQLTVPAGGTGIKNIPSGALLVGDSSLRLNSTTSPTVGSITATSTTSTSTFPKLSVTSSISILGEYFTNFTNYVRSLFSGTSPITYNSGTGAIGCTTASSGVGGCLSNTAFDTFNNKVSSQWVDGGSGKLYYSGGNVGIGVTSPAQTLDIKAGGKYGYNGIGLAYASTTLNNYFFGGAGNLTMTGGLNNAFGHTSLPLNTTGVGNTAMGEVAMYRNTTGNSNVGIGYFSQYYNTTGSINTGVGYASNLLNATGTYNTAMGGATLYNSSGSYNTAIGVSAGYTLAIGNSNTFLGYAADVSSAASTTITNSTAIGNSAIVTASNQVVIGNTSVTQTLLNGNVGIGTTLPSKKLSVQGDSYFSGDLTLANLTATGTLKMADVGNDLKFSADNTYDIGASAASRPRNVYIAGTATIGGVTTLASTLTGLLYGVSGVVTASSSLQFDTTNGDVVIGGAGLKGALHLKPINTANNWFTLKNDDNGSNEGLSIGKGAYPANTDLVNISPAALVTSLGAGAGFKAFNTGVAGVTYGLGGLNSFYTGQALTVGGSGSVNLQTYAGAWLTRLSVANDGKINIGTSTAHSSGMTLANGDLYVATSTGAISGVVLQASDASCHRITVDASNVISAATVPCP